jgi:FtsH-binding integral membrane protein
MERSFERSQVNFIGKTLLIMGLGLLLTFAVAILTPMFIQSINPIMLIGAMVIEVALVFYLTARINKMSTAKARMWFFVYAALNGFTLSVIMYANGLGIATTVFLFTSVMFFCSAMVGMTAKRDLSAFGQFFMMLLIGLLVMSVFYMFLPLSGLNFIISIIGIITFCGLTAYDMQKIKYIHQQSYNISPEEASKYSIIAALGLYLNFINLFLYVLRLFRDR